MQPEPAIAPAATAVSDEETVAALRAGDERTFRDLFARSYPMMKRVARTYVASDAVAEEIVQETWMAIVTGIDRFEGRSALGTWIFSILTNQAKTHSAREKQGGAVLLDRPERRRRAGGGSRPLSEGRRGVARDTGPRRRGHGRNRSGDCSRSRRATTSRPPWRSCPIVSG